MRKTVSLFVFLVLGFNLINAQGLSIKDDLPINKSIKKGVLSNGMTYYIYPTDVVKNAASYYIIQNVGSVLEQENQRGLAHFLEHMAFNGTENFPGKGILNTLQKHGAVFGKNINAYTGFDETVYNMDNIPTDVEGLVDTCLLVLHDWSNYLVLAEDEIDSERGVIKEEWRTRQNGRIRIYTESAATRYNNAIYANRMPIGLMDVVDNFEYKALKDFYHDWYRTDLQAIAVVGDFSADEMEAKIKARFSTIPAVSSGPDRFNVSIPDNEQPLFKLTMDKEVPYASIDFTIKHPNSLEDENVGDLKSSLLRSMLSNIVNSRIADLGQDPEAPFKGASIGYSKLSRMNNVFRIYVSPKPNKQEEALKIVLQEVIRAKKFGFSVGEIDRVKTQILSYYENYIKRLNEIRHAEVINMIKGNYLENEHMTDPVKEFELVKRIFREVDSDRLVETLNGLYTEVNRTVLVTGVEGDENLTEESVIALIAKVENNADLQPYKDDFSGKTLLSGVEPQPGTIVSERNDEVVGSTTFTMSNGVKVHYKYTNKNENSVLLKALSYGGTSLLADEDLPSANFVSTLTRMSGLGDFSSVELQKILTGKTARASVSIGSLTESINGSSVTSDVETMLQLVYLRFVKPRFDEKMYEILTTNLKDDLEKRSKNIQAVMQDSFKSTLYGDQNPKKRLMDQTFLDDLSFEKMKRIYKERISDISDFEFFIVGDVKVENLKPLLEKYIAAIPDIDREETWKDNTVAWLSDTIDKDIHIEMEIPKSTVIVNIENDMEYNLRNVFLSKTLGDILQLRYTSSLREEEGGTYGAGVRASIIKRPKGKASINISFDCDSEKVESLIPIVYKEIEKIKNGAILQEDLDKTLTNYLKSRKESKEFNRYEMSLLINYFREGYHMNAEKNFEDIVKSIKASDIQNFAKQLTDSPRSFEIVFKPKQ